MDGAMGIVHDALGVHDDVAVDLHPVGQVAGHVAEWQESLLGTLRMTLTPRPWGLEPAYSFLLLPAALHWLLYGPMLVGAWLLARRSREVALLLIFCLVLLLIYGAEPAFQGVRHRVQFVGILCWFQFHAVVALGLQLTAWRRAEAAAGAARNA